MNPTDADSKIAMDMAYDTAHRKAIKAIELYAAGDMRAAHEASRASYEASALYAVARAAEARALLLASTQETS